MGSQYEWVPTHGQEDWDYQLKAVDGDLDVTATVTAEGDQFVADVAWGQGDNIHHQDQTFGSLNKAMGWAEKVALYEGTR